MLIYFLNDNFKMGKMKTNFVFSVDQASKDRESTNEGKSKNSSEIEIGEILQHNNKNSNVYIIYYIFILN